MSAARYVDVLVVGGGPAGLAAGIVMARYGLSTLVCERRSLPADKTCGEGILPTGVALLKKLHIADHLKDTDYHLFNGIRYYSPTGQVATGRFQEGSGWGLTRLALSEALYRRALEVDRLEVRQSAAVESLERFGARIQAVISGERVRARLLVGADGLNSFVRRWAGLEGVQPRGLRWGARRHYRISPWSKYVEVYWSEGIEAYVTPNHAGQVGIAFLWDRQRIQPLRHGGDLDDSLLLHFPLLSERLAAAVPADDPSACGPLHRTARRVIAHQVALVGDASGYLDALTGEGISLALAQAVELGRTVAPLLLDIHRKGRGLVTRDLEAYARAHRRIVRPYYRMTRLALFLSRRRFLAESVIRLFAGIPGLFSHVLSLNMGKPL